MEITIANLERPTELALKSPTQDEAYSPSGQFEAHCLYKFQPPNGNNGSSTYDDFQSSVIAARMRKMTLQEDTAAPESIITMPKTPYIR